MSAPRWRSVAAVQRAIVACEQCARLREHCTTVAREKRRMYRDETYWGRPVPGFGDPQARLVIIGLAPGAHGANRTGRVSVCGCSRPSPRFTSTKTGGAGWGSIGSSLSSNSAAGCAPS